MARTKSTKEAENKKKGRKPKIKEEVLDTLTVDSESLPIETVDSSTDQSKSKSIFSGIFVKVLLLALVLGGIGYYVYTHKSDFIAARVDGDLILTSKLNKKMTERYGKQTLDDLITVTLIERELAKNNIKVEDQEISDKVKEIEKTLQGYTLEQALTAQGMTMSQLSENLKLQIGLKKLLTDKVTVSQQEVEDYIKQNGSVLTSEDDEGKKKEAESILKDQKLGDEINKLVTDLKAKAKVEKYL